MKRSNKQRLRAATSIAFALSALLFLAAVIFPEVGEMVGPLLEGRLVPYGAIAWLNTQVFGSKNSEGGILFVMLAAWAVYIILPASLVIYLLLGVLQGSGRGRRRTQGSIGGRTE